MLRPLRLARIAAEAEGLRLRYVAQRTVTRGIVGLIALIFLLGALGFFHAAFWFWLRRHFESPATSLIVAGGDLLIALDFRTVRGAILARSTRDPGARGPAPRTRERHQFARLFHARHPGAPRRRQHVPTRPLVLLAHPLPDTSLFIQPVLLKAAEVAAGDYPDYQTFMHDRHVAEAAVPHQP